MLPRPEGPIPQGIPLGGTPLSAPKGSLPQRDAFGMGKKSMLFPL